MMRTFEPPHQRLADASEPGIQNPNVADENERHRHGEPAGTEQDDLIEDAGLHRGTAFARV
jgi:hypothetical protein